jgi:hypothetical protein
MYERNMSSGQDSRVGKLKRANWKGRKAQLEARLACKKVKITMSDHLRLATAEARKYSESLEELIRRRDALRAVVPKGKHDPELYQLERQIRRRQINHTFRSRKLLLAGLHGRGRPKSFYRLALESHFSLTPKQYLDDRSRGRYLTKKQRAIVMKRLERIRASFLRSLRNSGERVVQRVESFPSVPEAVRQ